MHLKISTISLASLLEAARTKSIPGARGLEVDVFFVHPHQPVEIWDRISERVGNSTFFVSSEYAGEEPFYYRDGRCYRKTFRVDGGRRYQTVTFESSYYKMLPVSAILQIKRYGQTGQADAALGRLIICDTENQLGVPAFLEENLEGLEENMKVEPEREPELVLVGHR